MLQQLKPLASCRPDPMTLRARCNQLVGRIQLVGCILPTLALVSGLQCAWRSGPNGKGCTCPLRYRPDAGEGGVEGGKNRAQLTSFPSYSQLEPVKSSSVVFIWVELLESYGGVPLHSESYGWVP